MEKPESGESAKARPSFIKIAPDGKVDGLTLINNTVEGDVDFLDNQGELSNAVFHDNRQIAPPIVVTNKPGINWGMWQAVLAFVSIILAALSIGLLQEEDTVSVVDVQYELIDSSGNVIHRKNWQDDAVLSADERGIEKMLVSFKLRNPGSSQVYAKLENYTEIFANPYVIAQTGDFLNEMYAISAEGDSGFILGVDITPFTRVLPIVPSTKVENIEFYDSQGRHVDTAEGNIETVYGISIPYKVGIYNKEKELVDTVEFKIRCRAQMSNLEITLDDVSNSASLSKSLAFECLPIL